LSIFEKTSHSTVLTILEMKTSMWNHLKFQTQIEYRHYTHRFCTQPKATLLQLCAQVQTGHTEVKYLFGKVLQTSWYRLIRSRSFPLRIPSQKFSEPDGWTKVPMPSWDHKLHHILQELNLSSSQYFQLISSKILRRY
jgi:hypothetical protein